jgi:uncharacterized protein YndB with AHSA1/START domain
MTPGREWKDDPVQDRIEQEVTITAPLERVWHLVTRPGWWVPSDVEEQVEPAAGARTVRETAKWGRYVVEVVRVEPQTYASFRWASAFPGEELAPGKTTLIEFFVKPLPDAVSVTVVESGFAALDAGEAERKAALDGNTSGWQEELASLKERSERGEAE